MKKRPALLRGRASNPAGRYFRDIDYRVLFTNKKTTIASPLPHPLPRPHQLPRPHTAEGTVHNISGAHWRTGRAGVGLCPESRGERARGGWFSCLFIEFSRNGSLFTSVRAGRSPGFANSHATVPIRCPSAWRRQGAVLQSGGSPFARNHLQLYSCNPSSVSANY